MTTAELAKAVRYIQISTRKAVTATFAGEYKSAFKGRGMEFDEVREYESGDDIRTIDWNVSARTGRLHTKRFIEERELTIMLLADLSASGSFGSGNRTKNELAAEVCALLAYSAIRNSDRVGLLIFTDAVEKLIPPRKGPTHVLRLIREILGFVPRRSGTSILAALETFAALMKRKAVVFLVSDFLDEGFERKMKVIGARHDLIAVSIVDPRERELPAAGLIEIEDAETGRRKLLDTSSPAVRNAYRAAWLQKAAAFQGFCSGSGIETISLTAGEDCVRPLARFFAAREKRL